MKFRTPIMINLDRQIKKMDKFDLYMNREVRKQFAV